MEYHETAFSRPPTDRGSYLDNQGNQVEAAEHTRLLHDQVMQFGPDVVIIGVDSPDRAALEGLCSMNQHCPRPVVMFSDGSDPAY